jgi:hypothetical protein
MPFCTESDTEERTQVLHTNDPLPADSDKVVVAGQEVSVAARSLVVLRYVS